MSCRLLASLLTPSLGRTHTLHAGTAAHGS
jgi:hypothetical protein